MTKLKIFSLLIIFLAFNVSVSYGLGGWSPPNIEPSASAGADQTASEGATVFLDASGSTDPENTELSYLWTQTVGVPVALSDRAVVKPDFIVPEVGINGTILTFQVTVTDQSGLQSSDSCDINISVLNSPPVADAGKTQTVAEGSTITLSAAKSSDPDGNIQSYLWTQIAGPSVILSSSSAVNPTFVAPDVGVDGISLTFSLVVTDQGGLQSSDSCIVNVTFVNAPPVAEAGNAQLVSAGSTVTLDAGKSTDPDDGIASYLWTQTGGASVTLSDTSAVNPTFTAPEAGSDGTSLTFQVMVTDKGGLQSSDTCSVNVSASQSDNVVLAWDTSEDADYYVLYWGESSKNYTEQSNRINSPTTTYTVSGLDQKTYFFAVKAFNSCGNSSDYSAEMSHNLSGANAAPVADAGSDQSVNEGVTVSLDGSNSSDLDDGIQTYLWTQTSGPSVVLSSESSVTTSFEAPGVGIAGESLAFQLTVTDTNQSQSTDSCQVNVTHVNEGPIAEAGEAQTVKEGSTVTLSAAGSTDSDDGIQSYLWTKVAGPSVTLSSNNVVSPTFVAPDVGVDGISLTFSVVVTDQGGLQSSDACIVNVAFINTKPVADAGANQIVAEGSTVMLSSANSTDSDDGIVSYLWSQTGDTQVTLSDESVANPTFTAPEAGSEGVTLTFQLTVTDQGGLQSTDTCTVTVPTSSGESVALQWDSNEDADYYVVYWGENSKDYIFHSNNIESPTTAYTVTDLDKKTYYFAVKAFNACGNASDFSTEIAHNLSTAETSSVAATSTGSSPDSATGVVQSVTMDGKLSAVVEALVEPVSPESLITVLSSNPSIELFDSGFTHLEWLQIGWAEYNSANGEVRIATGDIDGDGEDEIILGLGRVPDNSEIPGGFFQILDHDYTHLAWGNVNWPDYNALNGETWPVCGDIDGDGDEEIIIGLGKDGEGTIEIFDYGPDGLTHLEWVSSSWDEYSSLIGETRPASGDIDGDGYDEIIVGLGPASENFAIPNGYFEIIESDYTHASWGEVDWPEYNTVNGETWLTCGDIYGNGYDEIIAGLGAGGEGRVEIFEYQDSEAIHSAWLQVDWAEYNTLNGETRPGVADIDDDGKNEIILGLGPVQDDKSIPGGRFQVIDDDFTLLEWLEVDWSEYNATNGSTRPVSGVINDGEIVFMGLGTK